MGKLKDFKTELVIDKIREGIRELSENDIRYLPLEDDGSIIAKRDNICFGGTIFDDETYCYKETLFNDHYINLVSVDLSYDEYKYICDLLYEKLNIVLEEKQKQIDEINNNKATIVRNAINKSKNKGNRVYELMQKVAENLKG